MCGTGSASGCGVQGGGGAAGLAWGRSDETSGWQYTCCYMACSYHDDTISQVEVDQDLLSGRIMKPVDPDEKSGDHGSLMAVPAVDRDACHTEWRETVVDEMEKFVLVPEVCPVVSTTSAAEPTVLLAMSEEYSPVVLAGGEVAATYPLAVVQSDTEQVSVLPVVGSELPAVFVGKVALDVVGLSVGPSCLRVDSEGTLPALLDERGVRRFTVLDISLDGGPMEGDPVLELIEHSVLEKPLDGGPMEGWLFWNQ